MHSNGKLTGIVSFYLKTQINHNLADLTLRDNFEKFRQTQTSKAEDVSLLYPYDLPDYTQKKNDLARVSFIRQNSL